MTLQIGIITNLLVIEHLSSHLALLGELVGECITM